MQSHGFGVMIADVNALALHETQPDPDAVVSAAVRALSHARQVPTEVIAEVCGVGRTAVFAKLNGSSAWKLREVVLLAEYFDVSVDDLVSGVVSVVPAAGLPPRVRRSPVSRGADGASDAAVSNECAWRDSNPQPSDP